MISFRFHHVCIESFATYFPPHEVSSTEVEDKLAPLYQRLQIPFGTLEKLSGIKTRYYFDRSVLPSEISTVAATRALEKTQLSRSQLGALFNCSVSRDAFEPATASIVHRNLELSEQSLVLDITNACIGFSDGMLMLGNLIESGVVKAGLLVSGENVSRFIDNHIDHLVNSQTMTREELLHYLPTFTLGSGAAAMVLCHDSIASTQHRLLGGVARSATQYNDLCAGDSDHCMASSNGGQASLMRTESAKLVAAAAKLGARVWQEASPFFGWTKDDVDYIFCHQVGKQVNENFYREMGLDYAKEFTTYKRYGNLISAALPTCFALGVEERVIAPGSKILMTAFGSGLNCRFLGVEW